MRFSVDWVQRSTAAWLALLLAVPFGEAATTRVRLTVPAQQTAGASSGRPQAETAATKAAAAPAQAAASAGSSGAGQQTATAPQTPAAAPPPAQQQQNNTIPVGTAAAPYVKALGVPASRPAGAAIAPAKQKRAHSFLIKIGVIVGAAIAVGAVVGLSKTTPSRPN